MEDLVLANAGVDAFEEVFKLIYAKLYDEWAAENLSKRKRALEFRVGRKTPREFAEVAADLFQRSTDKWKGVFAEGEKITLEPDHLCRPLESSAGVETCEYSWGHRVSMSRPPLQYRRGR
jgi:type I restriction enzyme M protein